MRPPHRGAGEGGADVDVKARQERPGGAVVALASDHAGVEACLALAAALREAGHEVLHLGPAKPDPVDYPDFAARVARAVASGQAACGVLICGTGIGMGMAANRFRGVRAAVAHDEYTARMSREHNDANVLCLGSRVVPAARVAEIVRLWLATPFLGGRHAGRVAKIDACHEPEAGKGA
ncbi:MAG: ribose 5-phosphate isomerase B [Planctomycetes bacterium]|nr:ribose 5-phosphate isomerase B [Planctomycetota bacterium]